MKYFSYSNKSFLFEQTFNQGTTSFSYLFFLFVDTSSTSLILSWINKLTRLFFRSFNFLFSSFFFQILLVQQDIFCLCLILISVISLISYLLFSLLMRLNVFLVFSMFYNIRIFRILLWDKIEFNSSYKAYLVFCNLYIGLLNFFTLIFC